MKAVKRRKELILGIVCAALGLFLLTYKKIVANMNNMNMGGYWNRADVWIRMWAGLLLFISVLVIIRAFVKEPEGGVEQPFKINKLVVISAVGLVLYVILLPKIGFAVCSFLLALLLNVLYTFKEECKTWKDYSKKELVKIGIRGVIYSLILTVVLWVAFHFGLGVILP